MSTETGFDTAVTTGRIGVWLHVLLVTGMVAVLAAAPAIHATGGGPTADVGSLSVAGANETADADSTTGNDTGTSRERFWSAPPDPEPETKTQPDGTAFEARQWGTAFRNGWETTDNYTVVQPTESGWWYYARADNGTLVATDRRVGVDSPAGLDEHARPAQMRPTAPETRDSGPEPASGEPVLSGTSLDSGTTNVTLPVVLADFSDLEHSYSADSFADLYFGTDPEEATGPGSLREYYLEASDGRVNLTAGPGVVGWVDTDMTHDEAGLNFTRHREFALNAIEDADTTTDFSKYDEDGDGVIDVTIVYPGDADDESDIWPHKWYAHYETDDGVYIDSYSLQNEMAADGRQSSIGITAHETGHLLFDWPDLYTPEDASIGMAGLMGTGGYGMENDDDALSGDSPIHPSVTNKQAAGWATTTRIAPSGQPGILPRASQVNDFYQVGNDSGAEQFLLAYRDRDGFDLRVNPYISTTDIAPALFVWRASTEPLSEFDGTDLSRTTLSGGANFTGQCPGCDGTVRLANVTRTHGAVVFNDPPRKRLAAGESAAYAVPVNATLPDGRTVGDEWRLSSRVAWADNSSDLDLSLTSPDRNRTHSGTATETSYESVRTAATPASGGWKLVQTAGDTGVDYYSATTYPTLPLPTNVTTNATDADAGSPDAPETVTVTADVYTGSQRYETGVFDQLNASSFTVAVGGETVPTENVSVTGNTTGAYTLTVRPPTRSTGGPVDLDVTVADTKVGVTHTTTTTTAVTYDAPERGPDAAVSANRTNVSVGETVGFDANDSVDTDGSIASYEWAFGDGATATGAQAAHAFAANGTYTVEVTVTDGDGATDNATETVRVGEPNTAPDATVSVNRTNVSVGETVGFDANDSVDPDGSIASYEWAFGDGATATGARVTHTFASNGTHTVGVTVTDDDGATDTVTVAVTAADEGSSGTTDDDGNSGGSGDGGSSDGGSTDDDTDGGVADNATVDGDVSATVGDETPTTGETVNVTLNASGVTPESGSVTVRWTVENRTVNRTTVELAATDSVTLSRSFDRSGEYAIRFANRTAGTVSVAPDNASEARPPAQSPPARQTETAQPTTARQTETASSRSRRTETTPSPVRQTETTPSPTAANATGTVVTTDWAGPGFGALGVLVGVLVAVSVVVWRRRRTPPQPEDDIYWL